MSFNSVTQGGGFVGCTLVNTKEGLVPIEKIKVGDWVLSQSEKGGPREYKRVVNTLSFENKEVLIFRFYKGRYLDMMTEESAAAVETIGITGRHPIWVKGKGWIAAEDFGSAPGWFVQLADGCEATALCSNPIYQCVPNHQDGLGWVWDAWGIDLDDGSGYYIEFRAEAVHVSYESSYILEGIPNSERRELNWDKYLTRVFNLEIEDFHTYYVGKLGLWVRSTIVGTI